MFDDAFYLPSDKDEVKTIQETGKLPIPTSKEYGRGAVVFPNPQEARKDAFAAGLIGGKNNPEAEFGRLARVRLHPDSPLIIGEPAKQMPEYRMIADKLKESYESEETQAKAEEMAKTLSKQGNNAYTQQRPEHMAALARARALMTPAGQSGLINQEMRNFTRGNLGGASKIVDSLRLPYDAVGDVTSDRAVAKSPNIVRLKDVKPLR
jgi:hypothetical protein